MFFLGRVCMKGSPSILPVDVLLNFPRHISHFYHVSIFLVRFYCMKFLACLMSAMSLKGTALSNTVSQFQMNEFTCCLYLFRIYREFVYRKDNGVRMYKVNRLSRVYSAGFGSVGIYGFKNIQ